MALHQKLQTTEKSCLPQLICDTHKRDRLKVREGNVKGTAALRIRSPKAASLVPGPVSPSVSTLQFGFIACGI